MSISWRDVTVAIPTIQSRAAAFASLLDAVRHHCPGAQIVTLTHDPAEPARVDFPRLLRAACEVGRPWILQLEDDVALAPNFGAAALETGLASADLLTLFSRSQKDVAALHSGEKLRRLAPGGFSMSQAFFVRAEILADIEAFAERWYTQHPQHQRAADLLLASLLSERKARCFVRVPSLVQHRRLPSTLPGHHGARQSETYRIAFGEVD